MGSLVGLQSTAWARPPHYIHGHFGATIVLKEDVNGGIFGAIFHQVEVIQISRRNQKSSVRRNHFRGAKCGM